MRYGGRFQGGEGIIQRPVATIHKHLGAPAKVVCSGPVQWVKSLETSKRCRTVRAPCNTTPTGGRPGPVLVCEPPPPRVLKDSGAGAMAG